MAVKLGSLLIELGMDSARFRRGTREAQSDMTRLQRATTAGANLMRGAMAGVAASLSVGLFTTAVRDGLQYASSLRVMSQQLGVTTRDLQELRYAAGQVGLEADQLDDGLRELTLSIGEAAAGSEAKAEAFRMLGVSLRNANGDLITAGEALPMIAEGLLQIESPAERAAILVAALGEEGQQLAPLLSRGAGGINSLRDAAQQLGLVLDERLIDNAEEASAKLTALKTVLEARIAGSVAENADSIVALVEGLADLVTAAGDALRAWQRFRAYLDLGGAGIGERIASALGSAQGVAEQQRQRRDAERRLYGAPRIETTFTAADLAAARERERRAGRGAVTPTRIPLLPAQPRRQLQRGAGPMRFLNDDPGDMALNGAQVLPETIAETARALPTLTNAIRDASPELQQLTDRLFPRRAAERQLADDIRLLTEATAQGRFPAADLAYAIGVLRMEFAESQGGGLAGAIADAQEELRNFAIEVPSTEDVVRDLADHFDAQSDRINEAARRSQENMQRVTNSIQQLANGLRSGGFLDIFAGILGVLDAVGQARPGGLNLFGLRFGGAGKIPGFANGTGFAPGGLAWVGERGKELVNLPRGSQVIPNHALGGLGGGMTVHVEASPYFDVRVDQRVGAAAPAIAQAGSVGAVRTMQRRQTRRLSAR